MVFVTLTPGEGNENIAYYHDKDAASNITVNQTSFQDTYATTTTPLDRVIDMRNFTQLSIVVKNTHASQAIEYQIEECYKNFADIKSDVAASDYTPDSSHTNKTLSAGAFSAIYIALFAQGINAVRVRLKASASSTAQIYIKGT